MYLFLHAPDRDHTFFLLHDGEKTIARVRPKFSNTKTADLLKHVHTLLKKKSFKPDDLKGVVVSSGPGQFSFLRSGIVIANTFAWALHIPVVGVFGNEFTPENEFIAAGLKKLSKTKKKWSAIVPEYGKEPNITNPRPLSFPSSRRRGTWESSIQKKI